MKKLFIFLFSFYLRCSLASAQVTPQWSNMYFHLGQNLSPDKMIVNDSGNVYVICNGTKLDSVMQSYFTVMVVKYDPQGNILWTRDYFHGYPVYSAFTTAFSFDKSGNIISSGEVDEYTSGRKLFTLKYSPAGTLLYASTFQLPNNPGGSLAPTCMTIDSKNNAVIAALTQDTNANFKIALVKFNELGAPDWFTTYGGPSHTEQIPYGIKTDSNDNAYICGRILDTIQGYNWIVQKYDSGGTLKWTDIYNAPGYGPDVATDLVLDSLGNIYVSGYGAYPGYQLDALLIKYDSLGNKQWIHHYDEGLLKWEAPKWIRFVNNNLVGAGMSLDTNNTNDYLLFSCDTDGTLKWIRSYDYQNHEDDYAYGFASDVSGNCYINGYNSNNGGDLWTLKTDPSGNVSWNYTLDNTSHQRDGGNDIVTDKMNNVYVTGETYNGIDCMITMKFDYLTNLPSSISSLGQVQVFPNPSSGRFQIQLSPKTLLHELIIIDQTGKVISQKLISNDSELSIDLSRYSRGIYFLHLIDRKGDCIQRELVIQ